MQTERAQSALTSALDRAMDLTVVPGYTRIGLALRSRLPGWPQDPPPDALAGRHVVVTGASSGLGVAAAAGLVALGAHAHLVVRNVDKGERAAAQAGLAHASTVHRCDLSDLSDVRALAEQLRSVGPLTALVHNAGAMPPTRTESAQGHELSVALHVLGPVLLTELLLPSLERARVLLVTSGGMYTQGLRADDPEYQTGEYSGSSAYARSKRMQVELLPTLQRRWGPAGHVVGAMHPGWADTPGVRESLPRFHQLTGPLLRDEAQGADTAVWWSATEPVPEGGLLWQDRRPRPSTWLGQNAATDADRARLWAFVREATGLPQDPGA